MMTGRRDEGHTDPCASGYQRSPHHAVRPAFQRAAQEPQGMHAHSATMTQKGTDVRLLIKLLVLLWRSLLLNVYLFRVAVDVCWGCLVLLIASTICSALLSFSVSTFVVPRKANHTWGFRVKAMLAISKATHLFDIFCTATVPKYSICGC